MTQVSISPESNDLIGPEEAMTILQLSDRSIKRRVKAGQLTQTLVTGPKGPERRFSRAEVEALAEHEARPQRAVTPPKPGQSQASQDNPENGSENNDFTRDILISQLEAVQADKARLWQEKEDAVKQWRDQFQYNLNLLSERKQLTEGEQRLKEQLLRTEAVYDQEKATLRQEWAQEKRALAERAEQERAEERQRLIEERQQAEASFKATIRHRTLTVKLMAWTLFLVVSGAGIAGLHMADVVKIDLAALTRDSVESPPTEPMNSATAGMIP